MKVTVRFAGYYRTLAGRSSVELELSQGDTVEEALALLDHTLESRMHELIYPEEGARSHPAFLIVLDTEIVERDALLKEGAVIGIVPPMAGGAGGC